MNVTCSSPSCDFVLNSKCVFYESSALPYTGINTNDTIEVCLQKIEDVIKDIINGGSGSSVWGDITGTITNQTDLITYLSTNYQAKLVSGTNIKTINGISLLGAGDLVFGGAGTVTSVAALTLGTTGTDLSSSVLNSTTTPVITLNVPTASALSRGVLSSTDWTTFNNKQNTITPAALSKVDDTNVTLSLGGSPLVSLLTATSLTLGWTGTLAYSRFVSGVGLSIVGRSANTTGVQADIAAGSDFNILRRSGNSIGFGSIDLSQSGAVGSSILGIANGGTGNSALAALTKVDDTNVTLTLGGAPSTALVNAASLTLGWTGQLGVSRGGTSFTSYTTGDLIQASGSGTLAKLNSVATGNALISGGAGTVSSWGKIGLTTHISGTLAVGNGGTGVTTLAAKSIWVANALDTIVSVTPGAGQSIRINAGNTAWEAYTPSSGGGIIVGTTTITSGTSTRIPFNDSGIYGEDIALTWDKTNNFLGVGPSTIDRTLHVEQDSATTNTVTYLARLTSTSSGTPANGIGSGLEFEVETSAANNEVGATMEAVVTDITVGSEDFDLVVKIMTAGAAATEKVRITSLGYVGIGESNPQGLLHLKSTTPKIFIQDSSSAQSASNPVYQIYVDDTANGKFAIGSIASGFSSPTDGLRLDTTGASLSFTGSSQSSALYVENGGDGRLTATTSRTSTNTVEPVLAIRRDSTGTPGIGIGAGLEFFVQTAAGGNPTVSTAIRDISTAVGAAGSEKHDLAFFTNNLGTFSEKFRMTSNGNIGINTSTFGTSAVGVVALNNGTAPSTSPANMIQYYSESGVFKYRDSSGNIITI